MDADIARRFRVAWQRGWTVRAALIIALSLLPLVEAHQAYGVPAGGTPIAQYPFDGDANDASGNGHHGSLNGGATFTSDRFGNPLSALSLDGLDDFVQVSHHPDLDINPTGFTVALWVKGSPSQFSFDSLFVPIDKSHGAGSTGWVIQGSTAGDGGIGFLFCHEGAIPFDCGAGNVSGAGISPAALVLDDQWHCIAGRFDPAKKLAISFFLDGKGESSAAAGGSPAANEFPLFIGRWGLGARHFHGLIDDVRLYHSALNQGAIRKFC